jgi:hypothetical protein
MQGLWLTFRHAQMTCHSPCVRNIGFIPNWWMADGEEQLFEAPGWNPNLVTASMTRTVHFVPKPLKARTVLLIERLPGLRFDPDRELIPLWQVSQAWSLCTSLYILLLVLVYGCLRLHLHLRCEFQMSHYESLYSFGVMLPHGSIRSREGALQLTTCLVHFWWFWFPWKTSIYSTWWYGVFSFYMCSIWCLEDVVL